MEVGLSLGSNWGNRITHLAEARRRIGLVPGLRVVAQAPLYETDPVGVKPEYAHLKFLNTVLILESELSVEQLHVQMARIENELGRVRSSDRFAPRVIDIDILYAGDHVMDEDALTIPHPRWSKRRFVLQPLVDVRPDLVLPGVPMTAQEFLAALPSGESVALFAKDW